MIAARHLARRLLEGLLARLFPADCARCGECLPWRQAGGVCLPCWARLDWTPGIRHRGGGSLRALVWAADYEGDVRDLIQAFKFEGLETLGDPLGRHAARCVRGLLACGLPAPSLVVPVPLHWSRRCRRGFNQAQLLARAVSRELAVPLATGLLRRTRAGRRQLGLGRRERMGSLTRVFQARTACRVSAWPFRRPCTLRGRVVLLVDDVTTTGATLEACAAVLRSAGASAVIGLAVARTR